ncbi:hypothetical protein NQ318_009162 [Aromia moschata]|uniref:Uncharacterized protein n=1 Tax=Aromia moschata TaxID=1265417 RepID=A0AAV8XZ27_9CUCU|nr:hypothetical protein NQ318_009162 [Aromia moschata]
MLMLHLGQMDNANRTILNALTVLTGNVEGEIWDTHVKTVPRGLNTTIHKVLGTSPSEILFGYEPRSADAFLLSELKLQVDRTEFDSVREQALECTSQAQDGQMEPNDAALIAVEAKELPKRPKVLAFFPGPGQEEKVRTRLGKAKPRPKSGRLDSPEPENRGGGQILAYSIDEASYGKLRQEQDLKKQKMPLRVLQANLQHCKAATAELAVLRGNFDVALIQEPWVNKGKVMGLGGLGELIYDRTSDHPRSCILTNHGLNILPAN